MDVQLIAIVAVVALVAGGCAGALAARLLPPALGEPALAERLGVLESTLPQFEVRIGNLIGECTDLLERTERKRRRAAADESNARKRVGLVEMDDAGEPREIDPNAGVTQIDVKRRAQSYFKARGFNP